MQYTVHAHSLVLINLSSRLLVYGAFNRLAEGLTFRGSNPSGGREIFLARPERPRGPPSRLYGGCQVFRRVKVAGA